MLKNGKLNLEKLKMYNGIQDIEVNNSFKMHTNF